jgi:hypothetical protein
MLPMAIAARVGRDGAITLCNRGCFGGFALLSIPIAMMTLGIWDWLEGPPDEPTILWAFLALGSPVLLLGVAHLFVFDRLRVLPSGGVRFGRRRLIISSVALSSVETLALRRCRVRAQFSRRRWYGLVIGAGDDVLLTAALPTAAALERYIGRLPEPLSGRIVPGWLGAELCRPPALL